MAVKKKNRIKLIEYLSDPENEFPNRTQMALSILGYKQVKSMYRLFSTAELEEIENEAWENRKARTVKQRADVYHAMYKRAVGYSHNAVHILSNRVKIIDKDGNLIEKTEALKVPIVKHYPPDRAAAQEYLDRTEGKIAEKIDHTIESKSGVLVVPGVVDNNEWIKAAELVSKGGADVSESS